jgi:hypothetical protein
MLKLISAVSFGLLLSFAGPTCALDLTRHEAPCHLQNRPEAILRQSVIVIDESIIVAGANAIQENQRWLRVALEVADGLPGGQRGTMNPSERISVFLARQDGSELAPIFLGCSPNLGAEERRKMEADSSSVGNFFSGGPAKQIADGRKNYENALVRAFGAASREKNDSKNPAMPGALLRALSSAPRLVDMSFGIPRIVLITPFSLTAKADWRSQKEAREAGFELGAQAGLDLQRAEVHVVGTHPNANPFLRTFADAFLLRSKGFLASWRSEGLPQLQPTPVDVKVFGGNVQIDAVSAPVQVRVAVDAQGTLVNSWIEVTAGRSLATPISGKAICKTKDACEVKGDGRLMGQAWNTDPGERPVFNAQYAWSGLRYFEMTINDTSGTVRIWDPSASIRMGDRQLDEFKFSVQRTDSQQF